MNRSTDRQGAFTRARVVSLALIVLAVLGLAYLRFAGSDRVSLPKDLAGYTLTQRVDDIEAAARMALGDDRSDP